MLDELKAAVRVREAEGGVTGFLLLTLSERGSLHVTARTANESDADFLLTIIDRVEREADELRLN